MKEEKFKVIQFTREFIVRVDKELDNFPRKDFEIKTKIRNSSFELLEMLYEANLVKNDIRKSDILEAAFARVKLIDFLLNLSYDKEIISSKKYLKLGSKLNDILMYMTGWLKMVNEAIAKNAKNANKKNT